MSTELPTDALVIGLGVDVQRRIQRDDFWLLYLGRPLIYAPINLVNKGHRAEYTTDGSDLIMLGEPWDSDGLLIDRLTWCCWRTGEMFVYKGEDTWVKVNGLIRSKT